MKTLIIDLDGTLADCSHRLHHVTNGKKNWDAFFEGVAQDTVVQPLVHLIDSCQDHWKIVLCSGRPEKCRADTEQWLIDNSVDYDHLYMRPDGDYRPDHEVKEHLMGQMIMDGYEPTLVIDDRPSVVQMWRDHGLLCLQSAPSPAAVSPAARLIIMVGPSGAGKSTWLTTEYANNFFGITPYQVISSDQVRHDLTGSIRDQTRNDDVFTIVHELARVRLRNGLQTVIDATNIRTKDRIACAKLSQGICPVSYVVIDRPIEEKLATAGWRHEVPGLIERHANTFKSNLKEILKGDGLKNVTVFDHRKLIGVAA